MGSAARRSSQVDTLWGLGEHMRSIQMASALLLLSGVCFSQEITGSIFGSVVDPSGRTVPNANITVINTDRNAVMRIAKTDTEGNYSVPLLPIGHHSLSVEAAGVKK